MKAQHEPSGTAPRHPDTQYRRCPAPGAGGVGGAAQANIQLYDEAVADHGVEAQDGGAVRGGDLLVFQGVCQGRKQGGQGGEQGDEQDGERSGEEGRADGPFRESAAQVLQLIKVDRHAMDSLGEYRGADHQRQHARHAEMRPDQPAQVLPRLSAFLEAHFPQK